MKKYFELTKKLVDVMDAPFCGNIFEYQKKFDEIKNEIKSQYNADEALEFELTRTDKHTAEARINNIFKK